MRQDRDLKRHELAVEIGVDPTTLYRWETGRGAIPDDRKAQLAGFFSVSIAYLMAWDEEAA